MTRHNAVRPDYGSSLPLGWEGHWTLPRGPGGRDQAELVGIKRLAERLAVSIPGTDRASVLGPLVGSSGMRNAPVHRWFAYKEGFSPDLLSAVIDLLNLSGPLAVCDAFGGVGTTVLSGMLDDRVEAVRSVEYSPLAQFVGHTKVLWPITSAPELKACLSEALAYNPLGSDNLPDLSSFRNADVVDPRRIRSLVSARDHVRVMDIPEVIRDVLLLGIAAVLEDLSGVMKDGRALRIKRDRRRRPGSLANHPNDLRARGAVKRALAGQWSAMSADVEFMQKTFPSLSGEWQFARGDARCLSQVRCADQQLFPDEWADLSLFSPPYLNCLDYTELYKLELWLLQFVKTTSEFRQTRLGTLRSHPSIKFPPASYLENHDGAVIDLVKEMSEYATAYGRRNDVGPMILSYFDDMFQVMSEQYRVLKPGGVLACVVANSTFSRRVQGELGARELWRMPVLTDVVLAHLAGLAGFGKMELWTARYLRPRNATAASARESIVVAWKP